MCTEVGGASAGRAFHRVPTAETRHIWKAPNCACVSVWRREPLGLGQAPSGTDLLTCCHLLLRYHHLVTLSNKTSNCRPFEARLRAPDSLFTARPPSSGPGGWPYHPFIRHPSACSSSSHSELRAHRSPPLPLFFSFTLRALHFRNNSFYPKV